MNYENAAGVPVPWYGTYTAGILDLSIPRRRGSQETSVDRHATEQEYYPSIITQENPNGRRGRTYD